MTTFAGITPTTPLNPLIDHSGSIVAGNSAQQLMAANGNRRYLFIQNISDTVMWINFGTTAVGDQPSIPLATNGTFSSIFTMENSFVCYDTISIFCASTGKKFVAKEA